jgi:gas vesicle protein
MKNDDKYQVTSFLTGAFIGGVVGAVLAMIFTPNSGEETRELIKKKTKDIGKKMDQVKDDLAPKMKQIKSDVKSRIREMVD